MYQIGTNPNAPLGGAWTPEQAQQTLPGASQWSSPVRGDAVAPGYFASFSGGSQAYGSAPGSSQNGAWFSSASSGLGGIMSSFYSAIQNLFAQITSSLSGSPASTAPSANGVSCPAQPASSEQGYTSATASSLGDPHLSFDGTSASGNAQDGKWEDMNSHADLIDSDSFAGGYTVATAATGMTNGVTYNKSATVTTDGGATAVTFSNDGTLHVTQNGQSVTVDQGQSIDLGNGEIVTSDQSGTSATVSQATGNGGSISTSLKQNGQGVDVTTTATKVDLGGYLVTGRDSTPPGAPSGGGSTSPISYGPIYAPQPGTIAGGSWASPGPSSVWNEPVYSSATSAENGTTSPYQLAGFSEPAIDEEFA